jgi:hypothetical protein
MALSGVYGVHTMDTVELLHSMNGYKTWRKEYLKKVMREQRALDS